MFPALILNLVNRNSCDVEGMPFAEAGCFEHPKLYSRALGEFNGSGYELI